MRFEQTNITHGQRLAATSYIIERGILQTTQTSRSKTMRAKKTKDIYTAQALKDNIRYYDLEIEKQNKEKPHSLNIKKNKSLMGFFINMLFLYPFSFVLIELCLVTMDS